MVSEKRKAELKKRVDHRMEEHHDERLTLQHNVDTAKGLMNKLAARAALGMHDMTEGSVHAESTVPVKNENVRIKGLAAKGEFTPEVQAKEEAAGNWMKFAAATLDLKALANARGYEYEHINLQGQIITLPCGTTQWGLKKFKNDGYARDWVQRFVDEAVDEDLTVLFDMLHIADQKPANEREKAVKERVLAFQAEINTTVLPKLKEAIQNIMGPRMDRKSKQRDFKITCVSKIVMSSIVIAGDTALSVATLGTIAPATGLSIAKETISILTEITKLAVKCEQAEAIVKFQMGSLYKIACEKKNDDAKKNPLLGTVDTALQTLSELVGSDIVPSVDNLKKWVKVHDVKVTDLQNKYAKLAERRDALIRYFAKADVPNGGEEKWQDAKDRLPELKDRLKAMVGAIDTAENTQNGFQRDLKILAGKNPDWAKWTKLVAGGSTSLALTGLGGQINGEEATDVLNMLLELMKEAFTWAGMKVLD